MQRVLDLPGSSRLTNGIITFGAVALLFVGIYLAVADKTASETTTLSFSFLFLVLLMLAKFRRFSGWGFEAEMWEQKQEELVEDLDRRLKIRNKLKEKIREKIRSGTPVKITGDILQEILIDLTDAM